MVKTSIRNEVIERQHHICARCRNRLDLRCTHIDHIKERQDKGKEISSNYQALCANCHNIKSHYTKILKAKGKKKLLDYSKIRNPRDNINKILGFSGYKR